MSPCGIITLLTDFGTHDVYVGVMKGVVLGIAPAARLVDLTHEVPPQDIVVGALLLRSAVEYFPSGTVHLAVVDPGVGSARDPVAVITERGYMVGPDNGLLYPAARALGLREVRRLDQEALFRRPVSRTFHGRDIFAPVAAHLAAGATADSLGTRKPELQPLDVPEAQHDGGTVRGEVVYVDRFGNLITNIPGSMLDGFAARRLSVSISGVTIAPLSPSYAAVPGGSPLAIIGSWGMLEVAVRGASAADQLRVARGTGVTVTVR